jgi:hypothetical protein
MSWFDAGLLGENVGLIRIHREPIDSARSLLQHPELVAQLGDTSLERALQVIMSYDRLADEQQSYFPGPLLSLNFEDLIRETSTGKTELCISAIDRFIDSLMASDSTRKVAMAPR